MNEDRNLTTDQDLAAENESKTEGFGFTSYEACWNKVPTLNVLSFKKKNLKAIRVGLGFLFLNKLEENTIFHISLRFTSAYPARIKSKWANEGSISFIWLMIIPFPLDDSSFPKGNPKVAIRNTDLTYFNYVLESYTYHKISIISLTMYVKM